MKAAETLVVRAAKAWGRCLNLFRLIRVEISVFPVPYVNTP
jgi:hypothetical protein